jgi:hypothetical protein
LFAFIHSQDVARRKEVEELILKIQTLLISRKDGVDVQNAAEDLLRNTDYDRFDGGIRWGLSGKKDPAPCDSDAGGGKGLPSKTALNTLRQANAIQDKLDALRRALPTLQWELFSRWWEYDHKNSDKIKGDVRKLSARLLNLANTGPQDIRGAHESVAEKISHVKLPCEPSTKERYHQYQDPTAGLRCGWPKDHTEETKVVMGDDLDLPAAPSAVHSSAAQQLVDELVKVMPEKFEQAMVKGLVDAFLIASDTGSFSDKQPKWAKQPWCPLFLEWEVEYYHTPHECWSLDRYSTNGSDTVTHIRWGIKPGKDVSAEAGVTNVHKVDGRVCEAMTSDSQCGPDKG